MTEQKKYLTDTAISPGETLNDLLVVNEMTQAELAERMGMSKKHINHIINGKTSLTPETALKLEKIFKPPASFWLNLAVNYQAARVRLEAEEEEKEKRTAENIPYSEMEKLGWVEKAEGLNEKIDNLRNFFRVSNLNVIRTVYGAAYTDSKPEKVSSLALAAWLERGEYLARGRKTTKFSRKRLESYIPCFRRLTCRKPEIFQRKLRDKLNKCGVAFVMVPYLSGIYVQGAVKWLSPKKVMLQMSFRHKFADNFWFTFFHEIGHILLHGKRETYIEFDREEREEIEEEADEYAANILIPEKEYRYFITRGDFSKKYIKRFAERIELDPGIIVGRLQFSGLIGDDKLNELRKKYNWKQFNEEY